MLETIGTFFSDTDFMPHGHCYLWNPFLLWTMAGSDTLIAVAYFTISILLIFLVKKANIPFERVFLAFGIFISACGAGHLIDLLTLWYPFYWVTAAVRVVTATASVLTAVFLFRLVPRI